jgi:hypothetical protein
LDKTCTVGAVSERVLRFTVVSLSDQVQVATPAAARTLPLNLSFWSVLTLRIASGLRLTSTDVAANTDT